MNERIGRKQDITLTRRQLLQGVGFLGAGAFLAGIDVRWGNPDTIPLHQLQEIARAKLAASMITRENTFESRQTFLTAFSEALPTLLVDGGLSTFSIMESAASNGYRSFSVDFHNLPTIASWIGSRNPQKKKDSGETNEIAYQIRAGNPVTDFRFSWNNHENHPLMAALEKKGIPLIKDKKQYGVDVIAYVSPQDFYDVIEPQTPKIRQSWLEHGIADKSKANVFLDLKKGPGNPSRDLAEWTQRSLPLLLTSTYVDFVGGTVPEQPLFPIGNRTNTTNSQNYFDIHSLRRVPEQAIGHAMFFLPETLDQTPIYTFELGLVFADTFSPRYTTVLIPRFDQYMQGDTKIAIGIPDPQKKRPYVLRSVREDMKTSKPVLDYATNIASFVMTEQFPRVANRI